MRRDTARIRQIAEIVSDTLRADFDKARILDVRVFSDEDSDGDDVLRIEVVFEGAQKDVDARKLSGAIRHVRPKLSHIGEEAFPLFSFISKGDAGARNFEPA
ncbi:MAG TPA: hypothetical protein VFJ18_12890 [Pararhizobium sp.]|nr:hypothetical protein [Pararhizobium sp.]